MTRVLVAGLGNVLMGDDGFGPTVARTFAARWDAPAGVEVEDLGTPGLDLIPYVADLDALILVDTVLSDAPAGTIRLYRKADVLRHPPQLRVSPHDPGVKEALLHMELLGRGPAEVLLIGLVAGASDTGPGLSSVARAAIPRAEAEILRELGRLGAPASPADPPRKAELWWETFAPAA